MTLQIAIELAVEGGYDVKKYLPAFPKHNSKEFNEKRISVFLKASQEKILLDRNFWIALGKQLGWGEKVAKPYPAYMDDLPCCVDDVLDDDDYYSEWLSYWHDFIDHLADGGNVESFFKELK